MHAQSRSYQEVGGSPLLRAAVPVVEVLTPLKWEKKMFSFQKVQLLKKLAIKCSTYNKRRKENVHFISSFNPFVHS